MGRDDIVRFLKSESERYTKLVLTEAPADLPFLVGRAEILMDAAELIEALQAECAALSEKLSEARIYGTQGN